MGAVRRLNEENPGAEPIVLEALTKEQRAVLLLEERAFVTRTVNEYSKKMAERIQASIEKMKTAPPVKEDPDEDWSEKLYSRFREQWESAWAKEFGTFETTTRISAMYYADRLLPDETFRQNTLQIFSVKVARTTGALKWPLDVFGMIAVCDDLDHNRNIIFNRTRDNCQTLIEQDPYLVLTGPTRAPVCGSGPVYFDAELKVKGSTESEDQDLCLVATRYYNPGALNSVVVREDYTSKHNMLEVTFGVVLSSIEATIAMRIIRGSLPDGFQGRFTAYSASMDQELVLLDSRNEKVHVTDNGIIEFSRRVLSVGSCEELMVSAEAWEGGHRVVIEKSFKPKDSGRSWGELDLGFCMIEVTVAWSLFAHSFPSEDFPQH